MVCYKDDICIGATNENELKRKAISSRIDQETLEWQ